MISPPASEQEIHVLICSANLGNAPPDAESVNEWIPKNGLMAMTASQQRFPVIMDPKRARNPPNSILDPRSPASPKVRPDTKFAHRGVEDQPESCHFLATKSSDGTSTNALDHDELRSASGSSGGSAFVYDENQTIIYDLVVIGMQEATFESDKKDSFSSDANTSGDEEMELLVNEFNASDNYRSANQLDFDCDFEETTTKRKSVSGKILSAGLKIGKAGLMVGKAGFKASKKVTKATVKTAKTVNTLASYKDHSDRCLPSAMPKDIEAGFPGWSSTDVLHYRFEEQLPRYKRALSYQLGEMRLVLYYNPLKVNLDVLGVKCKATGIGGLANKGGIVAEVTINDSTRVSFLTAHLEAHEGEEKYQARCTSFMDILSSTKSSTTPVKLDASLASHFTFCLGDLNFRTRIPGVEPGSERHIKISHKMTTAKDWILLNRYDELASALRNKDCLAGFRTPYCNFDPTFKVSRKDGYEYNPKRSPSFTDRILFKTADQLEPAIQALLYEPIEHFTTSDHKPIRGAFTIRLNDSLKWRPTAPIHHKSKKKNSNDEAGAFLSWNRSQSGNRETMHILASSMSVVINPTNYDKLRKTEKAGLPNSYLSFITTPAESLQVDFSDKSLWRKLDLDSTSLGMSEGKKSKSKSTLKVSSKGFPRTRTVKDTMKPQWTREHMHFAIRTHLSTGDPIDLTGALLHATLHDQREDKSIGTCSINLAKLIQITKNPSTVFGKVSSRARPRAPSVDDPRGSHVLGQENVSSVVPSEVPRSPPLNIRLASPHAAQGDSRPGRDILPGFSPPVSPKKSSIDDRFRHVRCNSVELRPIGDVTLLGSPHLLPRKSDPIRHASGELRVERASGRSLAISSSIRKSVGDPRKSDVRTGGRGRDPSRRTGRPASPVAVRLRGSLKHVTLGASKSMQDVLAVEDGAVTGNVIFKRLRDLKVIAVQLDEALFEGGLEVARLKCHLDIWWVTDPVLNQT